MDMINLPPKGLIGVLVTPLSDKGKIDAQSLENLINFTVNHVEGFLTGVSYTGEGFFLPPEKKLELLRIALEITRGRVPLFLGITGNNCEETAKNIVYLEKIKKELNYSGKIFLFDCPLWYHSNRGLPYH